ncbi:hypothetical protein AAE478_005592 [Parahypoxylon ruwenzoriense]
MMAGGTNDMNEPEEGAAHKAIAAATASTALMKISGNPDTDMGDDDLVLPVMSDILQPNGHAASSFRATSSHQPKQQALAGSRKLPPATSIPPSPLPLGSRLAVHIRSLASSPPSHARQIIPPAIGSVQGVRPVSEPNVMRDRALRPAQHRSEELSLQPKKRGRPKGWKPGMSYATSSRSHREYSGPSESRKPADQSREPKRRGRPPRPLEPSARARYLRSNAEYVPFKCEWVGPPHKPCPAELQNMKTLRKHVYVVHGEDDLPVCRWGKCAARDPPIQFEGDTAFEEHMEKKHFLSLMWYMGEGHQNNGISTIGGDAGQLPTYLFDKDGNQVTPSVTEQRFEDDQQHKERRRKLRRLLIQTDENAPTEEEYVKQTLGIV